jgi:hypothetical protein
MAVFLKKFPDEVTKRMTAFQIEHIYGSYARSLGISDKEEDSGGDPEEEHTIDDGMRLAALFK